MPGVDAFLAWLAEDRGRAANTVNAYRSDLAAYEQWRERHPDGDVHAYLASLGAAGRKPASVRRALMAIRALHRYLGNDVIAETPEVPPSEPDVLTADELDQLLQSVDGRDRALVAVLAEGGLRISEAVGLDAADVDLGPGTLEVVGHGSRDRTVALGPRATAALAQWLAERGPGPGAVFTNARGGRLSRQGAWAIVQDRGRRAGLGDRVTPDGLRRVGWPHGQRRRLAGHARPA